jgi:hypothetical protein
MGRPFLAFLAFLLGIVLAIGGTSLYIQVTYPNYYRDSGSPPIIPGVIFGCPGGVFLGMFLAWLTLRRRPR